MAEFGTIVWVTVSLVVLFCGGTDLRPCMSCLICSMASNSHCSVGGLPLMVFSRFLIALVMRSALLMVGVGRVWWRKVNVSVRWTAPVSVTALMHQ